MATPLLAGIRVLDMSRVLAAPFAAQMLGDLGAEVIKIERPVTGDDCRQFGPPFLEDADGRPTQESSFFISANRNKQSVTCDISTAEGQGIVRELVPQFDVLLENYKVGNLARYGLDYAALSQLHPGLIYCSITGFGQTGPYRFRAGYDSIFQGMGGLMSVTGLPDGEPGGGPMKTGPSLADILCGQNAVSAIIAALYHRDVHGGPGQHIDLALLDTVVAATSHYASQYLVAGSVPTRKGTEGNGGMPSRLFRCRDGDIMVVAGNDRQYRALCEVLGHPELADEPRFASNVQRVLNRAELARTFEPLFRERDCADILAALDRAGVPAGPINDMAEVFADPQVRARHLRRECPHPLRANGIGMVASPMNFSATPIEAYDAPPMLGQHTDQVLRRLLGRSEDEIAELRRKGVC